MSPLFSSEREASCWPGLEAMSTTALWSAISLCLPVSARQYSSSIQGVHAQIPRSKLAGRVPHQLPVKGFGFVQPRNDLRRSIIPPNFRELPSQVAAAMTTLIREDVQAADEVFAEYHSPIRGLRPPLAHMPWPLQTPLVSDDRPKKTRTATLRVPAAWQDSPWRKDAW